MQNKKEKIIKVCNFYKSNISCVFELPTNIIQKKNNKTLGLLTAQVPVILSL